MPTQCLQIRLSKKVKPYKVLLQFKLLDGYENVFNSIFKRIKLVFLNYYYSEV